MTTSFESDLSHRPKRVRPDRAYESPDSRHILPQRNLELNGVVKVLQEYDDYEGGINCSICGKLYKSKVCFTKHIWEHSVYWDLFEGSRNHDRVLSIQAALILYNGYHSDHISNDLLSILLVTAPHVEKKKDDLDGTDIEMKDSDDSKEEDLPSPLKRRK